MREQPDGRLHTIDLLRFAAAFGIVWAHMLLPNPSAAVGYTALSIFLMLVPFLSVRNLDRRGADSPRLGQAGRYVRVRRILWPWLFWCLVFKLLLVVHLKDPWALFRIETPYSLLVGSAVHLWFLPFVLIASAVLLPLSRAIRSRRALVLASVAAALISTASFYLHDTANLPEPFAQWSFALPPFLYGLLAAYGRTYDLDIVPAISFVGVCLAFWVLGQAFWAPFCILAVPALALALLAERQNRAFHVLGTLSYGIYLMHPIFMHLWHRFDPAGAHLIVGAFMVFALSSIATAVMLRLPFLRTVV